MFVDAEGMADGTVLETAYCIVGAGPAGISIALDLAGQGRDVILVESGGFDFSDEQQDLARGTFSGAPYSDLDLLRIRMLGGTSYHWGGQSIYLDPIDFEERPFVPDSGWPISHETYREYLPRAADYCGLTEVMAADDLRQGLIADIASPFDGEEFRQIALFYAEEGPRRFGEHFREELERSEAIRVLLNAPVRRVESTDSGQAATALTIETLGGRRLKVSSRYFVLACGGIEIPRLLLLSGPPGGPGLGNERDVVGRYFMEHPNYFVGNFDVAKNELTRNLRRPGRGTTRIDFQFTPAIQRARQVLNHSAYLVPTENALPIHRDLSLLSKIWRRLGAEFESASYKMLFRFEHAPNPDSRVTLGEQTDRFGDPRPHLNLAFGELESRTLDIFSRRFAELLGAEQIGHGSVSEEEVRDWIADPGWQIHHCGGCRMGTSPATSVVDPDCRLHGVDNLFVAGSSVFPTCGHANPTINLVALALRLSDHLKTLEV